MSHVLKDHHPTTEAVKISIRHGAVHYSSGG